MRDVAYDVPIIEKISINKSLFWLEKVRTGQNLSTLLPIL